MSTKVFRSALKKIPAKREAKKLASTNQEAMNVPGQQSIQSLIKEYRKSLSTKPFANSYWTDGDSEPSPIEKPKDEKLLARKLLKFQSITNSHVVGGSIDADDLITKLTRLNIDPASVPANSGAVFHHLVFDDRNSKKVKRKIEFKRLRYKMGIQKIFEKYEVEQYTEDDS
jgi:hypothetical protein